MGFRVWGMLPKRPPSQPPRGGQPFRVPATPGADRCGLRRLGADLPAESERSAEILPGDSCCLVSLGEKPLLQRVVAGLASPPVTKA